MKAFGMRSGAHSAWAGANSIADGVTVDFGYMNTTTYDDEAKMAKIQPGWTWGHVLSSLDPYGVTTDIVANGPGIMWLVEFTVDTLETQEQILPRCLEFRDAINRIADENGAQKNWDFLNYANGDQDSISTPECSTSNRSGRL
ncbi:hypothetical protein N0V84_000943 [Fusarium piperis]|uniref:Uncharacterized protein n=1 Tax=Fusarium piperis TaxID=1435070 RepID=A0A9W8WLW0_9HYPO|nr:hypothetical protein N0V84_000943 [Fusarium piperis]